MKRFWKKQFTAALLVLAMMVSLVPAAMAEGEGEQPSHTHSYGDTWEKNATQHWKECTGESCTEKSSVGNHQFTYTALDGGTQHEKECSVCRYKATESHRLTYVKDGSTGHYQKCADCGYTTATVAHTFSGWATTDNVEQHWKKCTACDYDRESLGAHEDDNENGYCDVCNIAVITVKTTVGTKTTTKVVKQGATSVVSEPTVSRFVGWTTDEDEQSWDGMKNTYSTAQVNALIKGETRAAVLEFYAVIDEREVDDITIEVDAGEETYFEEYDFQDAYDEHYNDDFKYVTFKKISGDFTGKIFEGEKEISINTLTSTSYYAYERNSTHKLIEDLYVEADRIADDSKLVLDYTVHGENGYYVTGTLELIVNGNADPDIVYEVEPGKTVELNEEDFWDFYSDARDSSRDSLEWVKFDDLPASSAGTLYYNYGEKTQKKVSTSTKYYYDGEDTTSSPALANLTFVASKNFKNTEKIIFTAGDGTSSSKQYKGILEFQSTKNAEGDIVYKVAASDWVNFYEDDFNDYYQSEKDDTKDIKYVVFDNLPASTAGAIYVDYGTRSEKKLDKDDFVGTRFYYGSNGGKNDYKVEDLTFEASKTFRNPVKIGFTAYYGTSSSQRAEGTLVIQPETAPTYAGNIRYATTTGTKVQINANDIARFFNKTYPYYDMQYVTFTGIPATGTLYYNYYGASYYGSGSAMQLTASNCGKQNFYFSPSNTSQYALTELTYVPSGTNYCTTIPFIAYGGNRSVAGTIMISVNGATVKEVYTTTAKNTAVTFPASTVYSAVASASSTALGSIQLLALPTAAVGTVYVGTATPANTATAYTYGGTMNQLRFVPATGYTGPVELPYVALNAKGVAIASGVVSVGVVNAVKKFSDVTTATWCYKYVTELADAKVIDGYANGSFKPNDTVTYGAALKLVMLAAGYPEQAPTVKGSTFSGYLAKAKADGIVTGTVDLKKPITRLQVAQLAAKAMKLSINNLSTVKPFTDTSDPYVQALNAAGIVEGYFSNGTSTYRPANTLTRGQISAIVWRMRNFNK